MLMYPRDETSDAAFSTNPQCQLEPGDRVWFAKYKRAYTVRAANDRFAICTQPFNPKKTVLYTIVDWARGVRGTNNLVFNMYDYAVQDDVVECLFDLMTGQVDVSHRNRVALDIVRVEREEKHETA